MYNQSGFVNGSKILETRINSEKEISFCKLKQNSISQVKHILAVGNYFIKYSNLNVLYVLSRFSSLVKTNYIKRSFPFQTCNKVRSKLVTVVKFLVNTGEIENFSETIGSTMQP